MRVLHVAETIRGGPATVLTQHLLAQVALFGQENVRAIVPDQHADDLADVREPIVQTFHRTGRDVSSLIRLALASWRTLRAFKPTVVHLHSTFAGVVLRLALLGVPRAQRPRVVYCPHAWAFMMDGAPLVRRLYARIERMLLPLTDVVICVSEYERRVAQSSGLPSAKLRVIHNGVAAPGQTAVAPRATHGPLHAVFVGRLDRQKGFDILTNAVGMIPADALHLEVIGAVVLDTTLPVQRPNVVYRGWQSPAQVQAALRAADVLIMPSRWESFGLVAVEAQKCGCAVLATNVCSLPEVVTDGVTGHLVAPEDPQALATVLMGTSKAGWQAMGAAAAVLTRERFTVDVMVSETVAVYHGAP